MSPRYQVDIAPVDQQNSTMLVVHHLALAFGFFQAVPEGNEREELLAEIDRRFQGFNIEMEAAHAAANSLCDSYDALKEDD